MEVDGRAAAGRCWVEGSRQKLLASDDRFAQRRGTEGEGRRWVNSVPFRRSCGGPADLGEIGLGRIQIWALWPTGLAIFLFLYFSISFFIKIYFCFRNLQEYTPTAPLQGGRNFSAKNFVKNLRLSF